jgi:hypothetical protein
MKLILILLSSLALSGCASNCHTACIFGIGPGNSLFDSYADSQDRADGCQLKGKPLDYTLPSYCGSSRGKIIHITRQGNTNSYIIKTQ